MEVVIHKRSGCSPRPDSDVDSPYQPTRSLAVGEDKSSNEDPQEGSGVSTAP